LCATRAGTFYIAQSDDERYHPVYKEECLGELCNNSGVDYLAGGHTFTIGNGIDTASLIPDGPGRTPQDFSGPSSVLIRKMEANVRQAVP
jgi:hypothetical protein